MKHSVSLSPRLEMTYACIIIALLACGTLHDVFVEA